MKKIISIVILLITLTGNAQKNKLPYKIEGDPIEFMEDGGWCWYQDPRAIIHNGTLIIGTISGKSGDIRVGVYDLNKEKSLGVVVLYKGFEKDDHNSPVFYARPDGSILACWSMHGKENKHYFSISDPKDYTKWSTPITYVHDFDIPEGKKWRGVTYMNLYTIKKQGLLYNFFRNGPTYNPSFFISANNGDTWSKKSTHFVADEVKGRQRPYARYAQLNENLIGVSFTEGHPRNFGNSLYYAAFDGENFLNANGSIIKKISDGPLKISEAEKLYKGSETLQTKRKPKNSMPNSAWTCELKSDRKGKPYIGYTLYNTNDDIRFRLSSWDGKKWSDRQIAYAGACLYEIESSYTGLMAMDPENPKNIFISTPVDPTTGEDKGGKHEIYMGYVKKKCTNKNINWQQVTFNSKQKNIRPMVVAGDGYKVVLWLGGKPWEHFQNYETDVMGYILKKPKKINVEQ